MSGCFSVDDVRLLEKTISLREKMIDNLLGNDKELPVKARDLDAAVNLLESVDRSILQKAKLKIDEGAADTDRETKSALLNLMLGLHDNHSVERPAIKDVSEAPVYQSNGMEINPGVLISGIDNFVPEDLQD